MVLDFSKIDQGYGWTLTESGVHWLIILVTTPVWEYSQWPAQMLALLLAAYVAGILICHV